MYCSKCGKEIPGNSKFCSGCGEKVTAPANGPLSKKPLPKKKSWLLSAVLAGILAALCIVFAIAFFILSNKGESGAVSGELKQTEDAMESSSAQALENEEGKDSQESSEYLKAAEPAGASAPLGSDTSMSLTGWVQSRNDWYYYDENHQLVKGRWLTIDGKDYCFAEDGTLYVDATPPDGQAVGSDGAKNVFQAPYMDIVNQNKQFRLYLSNADYYTTSEENRSRFIDHGTYFEITNGCILTDTRYDQSLVESKRIGETLQLKENLYKITDIQMNDNGSKYVGLEYVSGVDSWYYSLYKGVSDSYYVLVGDSDDSQKDTLYTGSLYFTTDCTASAFDMSNDWKKHTVSFKDYATVDHDIVGAEHGLSSYYGLTLWGDFEIDSQGYITFYDEYFVS